MKMGNVSTSVVLGLAICLSAGDFNSVEKSAYTDDPVSKTLMKRSEEGKRTFS